VGLLALLLHATIDSWHQERKHRCTSVSSAFAYFCGTQSLASAVPLPSHPPPTAPLPPPPAFNLWEGGALDGSTSKCHVFLVPVRHELHGCFRCQTQSLFGPQLVCGRAEIRHPKYESFCINAAELKAKKKKGQECSALALDVDSQRPKVSCPALSQGEGSLARKAALDFTQQNHRRTLWTHQPASAGHPSSSCCPKSLTAPFLV
jgi:hypothetical protein